MTEENVLPEGKIHCACGKCDEIIPAFDKRGRPRRFKNGHILRIIDGNRGRKGIKNVNWKGGRIVNWCGYIMVKMPEHPRAGQNGFVFEHILVLEQKLGRRLLRSEVTHHINGNKQDNRPENLEALSSQSVHAYNHGKDSKRMKGNTYGRKNAIDMSKRKCCDCDRSVEEVGRKNWTHDKKDYSKVRCNRCYLRLLSSHIPKVNVA